MAPREGADPAEEPLVTPNELPPGVPLSGDVVLGPGESTDIEVNAGFLDPRAFRFCDVVRSIDEEGTGVTQDVATGGVTYGAGGATVDVPTPTPVPAALSLGVSPNPVHGRASIHYALPAAGTVELALFDGSAARCGRSRRSAARPAGFGPGIRTWLFPRVSGEGMLMSSGCTPYGSHPRPTPMIVEQMVLASRPPRLRGLSFLLAGLVLGGIAPVVARAAPSYYVYLDGFHQGSGSTPLRLTLEYPVGSSIRRAIGQATPGRVAGMAEVESNFPSGFSDGGSAYAQIQESADDFIITGGPGPSVTGTIHFRADLSFVHQGGFEGHGGNGANASVSVSAYNLSATGEAHSNNNNSGATGVLSAIGPSGGATGFDLTGSFPVGTPFNVSMGIVMGAATYGNVYVSPALASVHAGVAGPGPGIAIGNGNGTVMDLPAGYTVNSPAWGVANNQLVPVADVPALTAEGFRFERVIPNPSTAACRLAFTLPHEADASLTVFDVQGREVRALAAGRFAAGLHEFVWDGLGPSGQPVAAGIYLAVARTGGTRLVQRIARVR